MPSAARLLDAIEEDLGAGGLAVGFGAVILAGLAAGADALPRPRSWDRLELGALNKYLDAI